MGNLRIRHYLASDREAIGEICIRTGDQGKDATGSLTNDQLLPAIYAYPYVDLCPDLAWVVVDTADRPLGYIIGAADVPQFKQRWQKEWSPRFEQLFPASSSWTESERRLLRLGTHPLDETEDFRTEYPAEFHIDLLPAAQGGGMGRRLVQTFLEELNKRGVAGVAIGVDPRNSGAIAFYRKLGFTPVEEEYEDEVLVGIAFALDTREFLGSLKA